MIDYTAMFTAVQAAEKELRGMGLRVTPDNKLTPQAEREVELVLAKHGITNAKPVLDQRNILHLVPVRGRRPVLTSLQNAQREYERISNGWDPQSRIYKDALNGLLSAITDTLAGQELEAIAALRRESERATPMFKIKLDPKLEPGSYRFEVDRTNDPLTTKTVKGKIVYGADGPIGVAVDVSDPGPTAPPAGGCPCAWCVNDRNRKAEAAKLEELSKKLPPLKLADLFTTPSSWALFEDLSRSVDKAMYEMIMGQGLSHTYAKTPEPTTNKYRTGPVKPEARNLKVLEIKERARTAFSFPIGSITSAMLGDALGDAYKAGAESVKPETAYSGELRAALQGHGYSGSNSEWSGLLRDVATMVRNARAKAGQF